MNDQKISVTTRKVKVILTSGEEVCGETFLQLHGVHQDGLQRIGEVLNSDENFLPVRGINGVELINLEQVVSVTTTAVEEFDPLLELGEEHQIEVEPSHGETLQVRILVNLPGGKTRVKDFLNQKSRFLHFLYQDQILYIARKRIMRVKD